MISIIDRMRDAKAVRLLFAAVLALALSVPSALLAAPRAAWASGETITVEVDGLAAGSIPTLTAPADFTPGQPVNADPSGYGEEQGKSAFQDLADQKAQQGLEIKWTDKATGKDFDWYSTPVTKSITVKGTWVQKSCHVTLVTNDGGKTPERSVDIPWGKSWGNVENTPAAPTRDGWRFDGWFTPDGKQFDFNGAVKDDTTVTAKWTLADVKTVPTTDASADVPQTITGKCWIGGYWGWHPSHFTVSGFNGNGTDFINGASMEGICADQSAARPTNTSADFKATLQSVDTASGTVTYYVYVTPPGHTNGVDRNAYGLIGYQGIDGYLTVSKNFGGKIEIDKSSANPSISDGNSCYTLEGAEYVVYDESGNAVDLLTTDAEGKATSKLLPAGSYRVQETKAPNGYALDEEAHWVTVGAGQLTTLSVSDWPQNDPVAALLGKYDGEKTYNGEKNLPLGSATLQGAQYTVEYYDGYFNSANDAEKHGEPTRTWVLETNQNGFCGLYDEFKVGGDDFYYESDGIPTLPLGTIVIKETKAPLGYNLPQPFGMDQTFVRQITVDGTLETVKSYNMPQQAEPVYRGDVSFKKVDENQNALANIPFKITSVTTGESHVVVTDENGYADTAADWNAHTQNTNGNDWLIDGHGGLSAAIDGIASLFGAQQKPDATAGVWFGQYTENDEQKTTEPDDERGALPYDTYTLEELPCDANSGRTLVTKTFTVSHDSTFNSKQNVDLGTIIDWNVSIGTTATDKATGTHDVTADPDAAIVDEVQYKGAVKGDDYALVGTVMVKGTGEALLDVEGNPVTASKDFTATDTMGKESLELAIGGCNLAEGQELVVFEKLYKKGSGNDAIASHEDLTDEGQTVTVHSPKGQTEAKGPDGEKTIPADEKVTIVDTVSYENLVVGKKYRSTGTLWVKETGEALLDAEGNHVTASTEFTPKDTYGTVDVVFELDASLLGGTELVAFEKVDRDGKTVFTHEDINDESQTVEIGQPEIGTKLLDSLDGDKSVSADTQAKVTDEVDYKNLAKGKEHTLYTMLMEAETGLPLVDDADAVDQAELMQFTAEVMAALNLSEDSAADIPATDKPATDSTPAVEPETPASTATAIAGKLVADPSKAVDTAALEKAFADHAELVKHLSYGKFEFTPEKTSGTQSVELSLDASKLSGKKAVCYEVLVKGGKVPATHCDKDSTDQQVDIAKPEIGTELVDASDSDHYILPGTVKLVDTVTFHNLIPGKQYIMRGKLTDKATGEALIAGDSEVTAEVGFTPNEPDGTVDVTFELDASALADGAQCVAFEECWKDNVQVATHADLNDEGQTVTVGVPPDGTAYDKTGVNVAIAIAIAALLAASGGFLGWRAWRARREENL